MERKRVVGVASTATSRARSGRRPRIARVAVGALTFGAALLLEMPVAQATCSLLDLQCVTDTTTDAVDGVVDTATETVDDVVQDLTETTESATDAVEDVVEEVVTTVEETVDGVVTTVEETVDGGVTDPPPGAAVDEDVPADRPGEEPGRDTALAPGEGTTEVTDAVPTMADGSAGSALAGSATNAADAPAGLVSGGTTLARAGAQAEASALGGATRNDPTADPAEVHARSFGFAKAVGVLAFPMALSIVVALFLVAQHRLDRRAPKLALAPVEPDVLGF
jgi:hypothetical protein